MISMPKTDFLFARSASDASRSAYERNAGVLSRLKASASAIYNDDNRLPLVMLCLMLLLYGPLLWISSKIMPVDSLDFTFNSMLQHLLHGRFDVDPDIVRNEGYLR